MSGFLYRNSTRTFWIYFPDALGFGLRIRNQKGKNEKTEETKTASIPRIEHKDIIVIIIHSVTHFSQLVGNPIEGFVNQRTQYKSRMRKAKL